MNRKYQLLIITVVIHQLVYHAQCYSYGEEDAQVDSALKRLLVRRQSCSDPNMCLSQWGYCGYGSAYCGQGCRGGPCIGATTTPKPQPSGCSDPNACLSQYGYCGYTTEYCGQGCRAGPCIGATTTPKPQPSGCSDPNACLSQWGYCGYGAEYCGQGCKGGPCTGTGTGNGGDIINDQNFACAFNTLDAQTRGQRLDGLRRSGYKPGNADEAAVFLGHVYHETDGLKTLTEYCASSNSKFNILSCAK